MSANADREKGMAALTSVVAAVFLTGMKIVVGIMTGSLGILSEAAHSGLDLVAAVVTLLAVRVSGRPADEKHQYGHGKIENLSALFETVLLLVTCVWIIYEAISRLFFKQVAVEANAWSFVTMATSIVIDISRSRVLMRAAKKYQSQALEADALHFSTDVWSSSVVIVGLVLVVVSELTGITWLMKADALAALVVAMIVVKVSLDMGKRTIDGLIDTAPAGVAASIEEQVGRVPGVAHVDSVRVRRSGPEIFADVTISVAGSLPLDEAHSVAAAVEDAVRAFAPEADVMVHTDPEDDIASIVQEVHLIARRLQLEVHNVALQRIGGKLHVAFDLEVAPDLSLGEAHDLATRLEQRLHDDIPGIARIDSHIEPRTQSVTAGRDVTAQRPEVVSAVKKAFQGLPLVSGYHNITVLKTNGHLTISVHCTFDPGTPIREVHSLSDVVSERVRALLPDVDRVIVHAEP